MRRVAGGTRHAGRVSSVEVNYQLLGNRMPHLHWLMAPRFLEDVAPGDPLLGSKYHDFPEDVVRQEVAMLRELLAQP